MNTHDFQHLKPMIALALLLGCAAEVPREESVAPEALTASETPSLTFAASFASVHPSAPLVAGDAVHVRFDADRFYDIVDGSHPIGYFASTYHCYGYGCCDVQFPEVWLHYRPHGPSGAGAWDAKRLENAEAAITIPVDARSLEMYFSAPRYAIQTWYCGCSPECAEENRQRSGPRSVEHDAWDSRFGKNYFFDVSPAPASSVLRVEGDGVWQSSWRAPSGVRYGWQWDSNVWIDVAVQNLAYHKQVVVDWSVDDGPTHTSLLAYEGSLERGWERWGIDLLPAATGASCFWCEPEAKTMRYTVRYEVDGQTYIGDVQELVLPADWHEE